MVSLDPHFLDLPSCISIFPQIFLGKVSKESQWGSFIVQFDVSNGRSDKGREVSGWDTNMVSGNSYYCDGFCVFIGSKINLQIWEGEFTNMRFGYFSFMQAIDLGLRQGLNLSVLREYWHFEQVVFVIKCFGFIYFVCCAWALCVSTRIFQKLFLFLNVLVCFLYLVCTVVKED